MAGVAFLAVLSLSAGCAPRSMMVVSRTHAKAPLELTHNITLAHQTNPRPEDKQLRAVLSALLAAADLSGEIPQSASYVMGCSMDQSWDEVFVPVVGAPGVQHVEAYHGQNGSAGRTVVSYEYREPLTSGSGSRFLSTQGIRLALYSNNFPAADRPEALWEGYIELGLKVSSQQVTNALQLLIGKMGTDFIGRVPIPR